MRWRLKPRYLLFAQLFVQVQIKENIKATRHLPLWGQSIVDRSIPLDHVDSIWWRHYGNNRIAFYYLYSPLLAITHIPKGLTKQNKIKQTHRYKNNMSEIWWHLTLTLWVHIFTTLPFLLTHQTIGCLDMLCHNNTRPTVWRRTFISGSTKPSLRPNSG